MHGKRPPKRGRSYGSVAMIKWQTNTMLQQASSKPPAKPQFSACAAPCKSSQNHYVTACIMIYVFLCGLCSVPTNRPEPTNTNRNEPPGYGTGKWKRTAGTEPKFCGNRTENHSYIENSYVKLCENISIYTFLTPSFPSFPGLRIISIAEQLWPRNLYCNNGKTDQRM